jgi:hypothetical protein
MENILSEFSIKGLKFKLTDDKLYINTISASETFALRSLNGIGVIDLVDKYNSEMNLYKERQKQYNAGIVLLVVGLIAGLSFFAMDSFWKIAVLFVAIPFCSIAIGLINTNKDRTEPELLSVVRLMLNSGDRNFEFVKSSKNSKDVAEFVAKVESTLSAFHKNNS